MGRWTRLALFFAGVALFLALLAWVASEAIRNPGWTAVADLVLLGAMVPTWCAHAWYEANEFRRIPVARARAVRVRATSAWLVVASAWLYVRYIGLLVAIPNKDLAAVPSVFAGALVLSAVVVSLGHGGIALDRHRGELGDAPLRAKCRFLVTGPHTFGALVASGGRVGRALLSRVRAASSRAAAVFGRRALPVLDVIMERHGRKILAVVTLVTMLVFFVPLLLMAAFSFTAGFNPAAFEGFSLRWYIGGGAVERDALFKDAQVLSALRNSVVIGVASAVLSLFLGLLAAFAIDRYGFRGKRTLNNVMYLGLVIPSIVMGISLSILVRLTNDVLLTPAFGTRWDFGLLTLIVGHTTFNIPLATLVLLISFREFDRSLEEAAMNLGAGPLTTFFRVTLPNIKAGIVSTLLLTFTFSFDEYPVSVFLAGSDATYPIVAYGILARKIPTPEANAAATLILAISVVFVLLATKVQKGGAIFRI